MSGKILRPEFPDREAEEQESLALAKKRLVETRALLRHWRSIREWEPSGGCWCPPCPSFVEGKTEWCDRCGWESAVHG